MYFFVEIFDLSYRGHVWHLCINYQLLASEISPGESMRVVIGCLIEIRCRQNIPPPLSAKTLSKFM